MPTKKDGIVIKEEEKERIKVVLSDRINGEAEFLLLTKDQINLLKELIYSGKLEDHEMIIVKDEEWVEI